MIYFKKKPDAQFYFLIIGLVVTMYLALFQLELLCINDYNMHIYTKNGEIVYEKEMLDTKECYPIFKYFKEIKKRKEIQSEELLEISFEAKQGYSPSSFSFNSSLTLNSSSS